MAPNDFTVYIFFNHMTMEMNFHRHTCMSSQQQHFVIPKTKVRQWQKKKKEKTTSIIEQFRCGFFVTIQNPVTTKCLIIMAYRCVCNAKHIYFFAHCFRVVLAPCWFIFVICLMNLRWTQTIYMTRSHSIFSLSHNSLCAQCRTLYIFELKLSFVLAWSPWCILCVVRCTNNVLHVLVLWLWLMIQPCIVYVRWIYTVPIGMTMNSTEWRSGVERDKKEATLIHTHAYDYYFIQNTIHSPSGSIKRVQWMTLAAEKLFAFCFCSGCFPLLQMQKAHQTFFDSQWHTFLYSVLLHTNCRIYEGRKRYVNTQHAPNRPMLNV